MTTQREWLKTRVPIEYFEDKHQHFDDKLKDYTALPNDIQWLKEQIVGLRMLVEALDDYASDLVEAGTKDKS